MRGFLWPCQSKWQIMSLAQSLNWIPSWKKAGQVRLKLRSWPELLCWAAVVPVRTGVCNVWKHVGLVHYVCAFIFYVATPWMYVLPRVLYFHVCARAWGCACVCSWCVWAMTGYSKWTDRRTDLTLSRHVTSCSDSAFKCSRSPHFVLQHTHAHRGACLWRHTSAIKC